MCRYGYRFSPGPPICLLVLSTLILSTATEALQVIGGNMTVVLGGTSLLPCKLINTTETLTQISWQRKTRGKPLNDDFLTILISDGPQFVKERDDRFTYIGDFDEKNGSLQLSSVTLMDEGTYTCIFTLFPSGNHKTEILLNLLVPPVTSVKDDYPILGNEEVSLVTCTAAGSKPPAEMTWLTGTLEETVRTTTNSTQHANSTTTTISSLFGVPTREMDNRRVQCVITSAALSKAKIQTIPVQIYFKPMDVNISRISERSFECVTESRPDAKFNWTRIDQPWPQSAVRDGATLQFLSMTSDLNGHYQCEASNRFGKKSSHLYVHMTSGACTACWTLFSLLLCLSFAAAAAVWYFKKSWKFVRTGEGTHGEKEQVRTTSSKSEVERVEEERSL